MTDDKPTERQRLDLDERKLTLEQERLQWERDKAAADDRKYAEQSDRRATDLAKAKADAEKAALEAADLRIPFKDRPAYRAQKYQMVATTAAIVSLLVSVGTIKPALDAYFAEKNVAAAKEEADAAKAKNATAKKEADDANLVAADAKRETRETENHLDNLRTQVVPLEEQAEAATARRIAVEHDLDSARRQVNLLNAETKQLEGTKIALEKQVGTLSKAEVFQKFQSSISDSSTQVNQLLASRIRESLDPDARIERAQDAQQIYQRLQDNLNYVALARSLAQLFTADSESAATSQIWKFTYSMTDLHPSVNADDVGGTLSVLTTMKLLASDKAVTMRNGLVNGSGHRYFQITGDLAVPFNESPLLQNGRARSRQSFIASYRHNLAAYIASSESSLPGPHKEYRITALTDDNLWHRLEEIGNPAGFQQAVPGMPEVDSIFIGSEYLFVVNAGEKLARLSGAVFATMQAIQSGDADAYVRALNVLLAALLPFQSSERYFEHTSSVPWLLLAFDDLSGRTMTIKADCEITGLPRLRLSRP